MNNLKVPSKGYIVIASRLPNFYKYALNLIETIKDYDSENPVCLVTEEHMIDDYGRDIADDVIICNNHYRAKLWGMANSPYDITMYLDADMAVEHEDISTCFDLLGDNHLMFTALTDERDYIYAERHFKTPYGTDKFSLCGAVCLYDMREPLVRDFMQDWWDYCYRQMNGTWWPDPLYPESLKGWDQFPLWWLTTHHEKYKNDLKIGIFPDDLRWNWFNSLNSAYTKTETGKPPIIRHFSSGVDKTGEKRGIIV